MQKRYQQGNKTNQHSTGMENSTKPKATKPPMPKSVYPPGHPLFTAQSFVSKLDSKETIRKDSTEQASSPITQFESFTVPPSEVTTFETVRKQLHFTSSPKIADTKSVQLREEFFTPDISEIVASDDRSLPVLVRKQMPQVMTVNSPITTNRSTITVPKDTSTELPNKSTDLQRYFDSLHTNYTTKLDKLCKHMIDVIEEYETKVQL